MPASGLQAALAAAGLDDATIAEHLGVDVRTVQRWRAGRVPYPRHRRQLAALLDVEERSIWPQLPSPNLGAEATDLVAVYSHRSDAPRELWLSVFSQAKSEIEVLAYAALFLPEQYLGFVDLLRKKA